MNANGFDGVAIVYCQGAFNTPYGKTAHGLVRLTRRYQVAAVIDGNHAGQDAGQVLDGRDSHIPVVADLAQATDLARKAGTQPTHFVFGIAPDGGRLTAQQWHDVKAAIEAGLNVDCGLHQYISEDETLSGLARRQGVCLRDVRKPPPIDELHFFSGKIDQVDSLKIAVLGTDSAVGKRTTAQLLVQTLNSAGVATEMIGTGQTAWMQGVRYGLILDSLVNDFVSGEIEHAVWSAWNERHPAAIVIEGQGSLMNPAYPGGFEILAAGRPDLIVLQHAPARKEYDGFPGYPVQPLAVQIELIELLAAKPVVAVTVNHEDLDPAAVAAACVAITAETGRPALDVLSDGAQALVEVIKPHLKPAVRREPHD